jgi:hypothetical protein
MVIARVRFLGPKQGGSSSPPLPGYHPQVAVGDQFTSCAIESLEGDAAFAFEREHLVSLRLLFPDHYPDAFTIGSEVRFYEGHHFVGSGVVLEIR